MQDYFQVRVPDDLPCDFIHIIDNLRVLEYRRHYARRFELLYGLFPDLDIVLLSGNDGSLSNILNIASAPLEVGAAGDFLLDLPQIGGPVLNQVQLRFFVGVSDGDRMLCQNRRMGPLKPQVLDFAVEVVPLAICDCGADFLKVALVMADFVRVLVGALFDLPQADALAFFEQASHLVDLVRGEAERGRDSEKFQVRFAQILPKVDKVRRGPGKPGGKAAPGRNEQYHFRQK